MKCYISVDQKLKLSNIQKMLFRENGQKDIKILGFHATHPVRRRDKKHQGQIILLRKSTDIDATQWMERKCFSNYSTRE